MGVSKGGARAHSPCWWLSPSRFAGYWGATITGMMREALHVWALALCVFTALAARSPRTNRKTRCAPSLGSPPSRGRNLVDARSSGDDRLRSGVLSEGPSAGRSHLSHRDSWRALLSLVRTLEERPASDCGRAFRVHCLVFAKTAGKHRPSLSLGEKFDAGATFGPIWARRAPARSTSDDPCARCRLLPHCTGTVSPGCGSCVSRRTGPSKPDIARRRSANDDRSVAAVPRDPNPDAIAGVQPLLAVRNEPHPTGVRRFPLELTTPFQLQPFLGGACSVRSDRSRSPKHRSRRYKNRTSHGSQALSKPLIAPPQGAVAQ